MYLKRMVQQIIISTVIGLEYYRNQLKKYQLSIDDKCQYMQSYIRPNQKFYSQIMLFSGNSNPKLAIEVADCLNMKLSNAQIRKFNDGECSIQILDNVRGKDIYLIQSTSYPVNDNLMELILLVSAFRRSSAKTINVVVPYYAYSRQDHKLHKSQSIAAADIAKLLETAGIDRLLSVDLHRGQIQGFFPPKIPVDNIEAYTQLIRYFRITRQFANMDMEKEFVIVSPDFNGVSRAKNFQDMMRCAFPKIKTKLALIYKQKSQGNPTILNLVGNVVDRECIIIDDIVDSGSTVRMATQLLKTEGAKKVMVFATHPVFSKNIDKNIKESFLSNLITTNTIPIEQDIEKVTQLSVAPLLAEAIYRIQMGLSVSDIENQVQQ